MKTIIFSIIAAAFAIILLAGLSYQDAQVSAARTLPEYVDPDSGFEVTLSVDIDENNPLQYYILYEKIPQGLALGSVNPVYTSFNENDRKLVWIVTRTGSELRDQVYTYTLYSSDPGTYAFNGNIVAGEYSAGTGGNIVLKVKDNCTENWVCGYWSECVGSRQTRTCEDKNNCLIPLSMPQTSRSCTEQSTDEEENNTPKTADAETDANNDTIEEQETGVAEENDTQTGQNMQDIGETEEQETPKDESADEKEENTGEEKITGQATAVADGENQTELVENEADPEPKKEHSGNTNKMPLSTKILSTILIAEVILLALKKS